MRKVILIFLFILLFAGLATLVFGFYNAGNIRHFAASAEVICAKYDGALQLKEIEKDYQKSGTRDALQLIVESDSFLSKLDEIMAGAEAAGREVDSLNVPLTEMSTKNEMKSFYSRAGRQIQDAKNITQFTNQILKVAAIFGKIKSDMTLEEMKTNISEAKQENFKVDISQLPENLNANGRTLKEAMDKFLSEMENEAAGATENSDRLNDVYAEFIKNSRDYINSLENLAHLQDKIRTELAGLKKIYFKI